MVNLKSYIVDSLSGAAAGAAQRFAWGGQGNGLITGSLVTGAMLLGGFTVENMSRRSPMMRQIAHDVAISGATVAGWVGYEQTGFHLPTTLPSLSPRSRGGAVSGGAYSQRALAPGRGNPRQDVSRHERVVEIR